MNAQGRTEQMLTEGWEFQCEDGAHKDDMPGTWLPARVPGDVHVDLMAHGLMADPWYGRQSEAAARWEQHVWRYRTRFEWNRPGKPFLARLVFEGLDAHAEVFLNGVRLGETDNALTPHRFDAAHHLQAGENTLEILIDDGLRHVADRPTERYLMTGPEAARIWLRKPQFCFGWDWAPRLITCGVWRPVRLQTTERGFVDALHARPILSDDFASATVAFDFEWTPANPEETAAASIAILLDEETVAQTEMTLKPGANSGTLKAPAPKLWYPAGEGEQPLYELRVTCDDSECAATRFGMRRVRLIEEPVAEGGRTFRFEVNGRALFCRGGNWVPADSFPARVTAERTARLLDEAVRCGFNMLRVWGGGVYESDDFYRQCDERGILIWQDFMYACALYPDDDADFRENCVREAREAVQRLRNHPCIVFWTGNNEIHDGYEDVYQPKGAEALFGATLWDQALPELLTELAPDALYRPASPYGGPYHRSDQEGDCHSLSSSADRVDSMEIRLITQAVGRFMSEFYTWCAPPDLETIKEYCPKNQWVPFSGAYRHHANTGYATREYAVARRYIMELPETLPMETYVPLMQRLHGEHMAALIASYRRNIAVCGGALFWMYNDCWPTSGWTTQDCWLRRKALFYYVRRAFAPVALSFKEEEGGLSVWVSNLTRQPFKGRARFGRYAFSSGEPVFEKEADVRVPAGASERAAFFYTTRTWTWECLSSFASAVLCDEAGQHVDSARHICTTWRGLTGRDFSFDPSYWRHRSLTEPTVRARRRDAHSLELTTDAPAFSVRVLADHLRPDDNYVDLMPGQPRTLRFEEPLGDAPPPVESLNAFLVALRDETD